ncbi:Spx/MgsR family RNA polymerase-binding regulatory protein [Pusillimonas sp. ANT_WB101]|uniref:Spx/MgsR family RNA polymerase-binding regulatory protein n=1 Tax=Pusillimonas sp. ANT_WB101 TaxID=2597356 RepID=UPI0011EF32C3|nr:Spx/MgsR family RNA polymerase-binding regulatory protein [Pusillimonas sp. ANT_WB101]KAA0888463.1 Spx/MgsR family RNA polymerase-binding regulatory protein [Pusillimonas sp. ANT_WB101]
MNTVRLYGLKNCSTCHKATAWLSEHGVAFEFTDYRDHLLAPDTLRAWADELGGWPKLVNRASMTWRNLPPERKTPSTDEQWLELIAEFPALVRRPVTIDTQGGVQVGFSDKKYTERFG